MWIPTLVSQIIHFFGPANNETMDKETNNNRSNFKYPSSSKKGHNIRYTETTLIKKTTSVINVIINVGSISLSSVKLQPSLPPTYLIPLDPPHLPLTKVRKWNWCQSYKTQNSVILLKKCFFFIKNDCFVITKNYWSV